MRICNNQNYNVRSILTIFHMHPYQTSNNKNKNEGKNKIEYVTLWWMSLIDNDSMKQRNEKQMN